MTGDPRNGEAENPLDEARRNLEEVAASSPSLAEWYAKEVAVNPSFVEDLVRQVEFELAWRERKELAWFLISVGPQPSSNRRALPDEDVHYQFAPSGEMLALAAAVAIFGKAYLETLGKRAGEGTANLPKKVKDLVRAHIRNEDARDEIHVGVADGESATVIFTRDLPDAARLALLDLDVTAEELRGKTLRWDATSGWLPDEISSSTPD